MKLANSLLYLVLTAGLAALAVTKAKPEHLQLVADHCATIIARRGHPRHRRLCRPLVRQRWGIRS